jgi:hypothetical protein
MTICWTLLVAVPLIGFWSLLRPFFDKRPSRRAKLVGIGGLAITILIVVLWSSSIGSQPEVMISLFGLLNWSTWLYLVWRTTDRKKARVIDYSAHPQDSPLPCPSCGHAIPVVAQHCDSCGAPQRTTPQMLQALTDVHSESAARRGHCCSKCGTQSSPRAAFCTSCGTALSSRVGAAGSTLSTDTVLVAHNHGVEPAVSASDAPGTY